MYQVLAIALGGAVGSVLRFLVSSGVYQWLGRGFPYGTLTVNFIGSFLIGFLTEVLVMQRINISAEYRAGILVGVLGGFTTFSTFSLESITLLEQGSLGKAGLNVLISVCLCLFATWLGLLAGRTLFLYGDSLVRLFPYTMVFSNIVFTFFIGFLMTVVLDKFSLSAEYQAGILLLIIGLLSTVLSFYIVGSLVAKGYALDKNIGMVLFIFVANTVLGGLMLWLGLTTGKQQL